MHGTRQTNGGRGGYQTDINGRVRMSYASVRKQLRRPQPSSERRNSFLRATASNNKVNPVGRRRDKRVRKKEQFNCGPSTVRKRISTLWYYAARRETFITSHRVPPNVRPFSFSYTRSARSSEPNFSQPVEIHILRRSPLHNTFLSKQSAAEALVACAREAYNDSISLDYRTISSNILPAKIKSCQRKNKVR